MNKRKKALKTVKDILGILEDDDWPDTALANTWDEYIENLLPLGISNLFLFDGEQVKELAEQEAPPLIVFDAIRGLLGLELAERLSVNLEILLILPTSKAGGLLKTCKQIFNGAIKDTLHAQNNYQYERYCNCAYFSIFSLSESITTPVRYAQHPAIICPLTVLNQSDMSVAGIAPY